VDWLNDRSRHFLVRAAFALWRLNYIHPFPGGNGRTARALCFLVLCIEAGGMFPGNPSLPTLIKGRKQQYLVALQATDAAWKGGGEAQLADPQPAFLDIAMVPFVFAVVDDLFAQLRANKPQSP
jgi:Fic family protein